MMFTKIQGYTSMMEEDEDRAIKIRERHREVLNSITEKHRGKILQNYGDGTLRLFESAIVALKCGIDLQLEFLNDPVTPVRTRIHSGYKCNNLTSQMLTSNFVGTTPTIDFRF